MTREEVIKNLQERKAKYLDEWAGYGGGVKVYDMAIAILEQEPCKDCPWRRQGIDRVYGLATKESDTE